ncbi:mucin-binding protein, partial [Paucilactobacillus suebicus]
QSYNGVATADLPANATVTVTYTAGSQSATVEYVDDDADEAVVGTATPISGDTNATATWTSDNKPAGYVLADGQAASGSYTFTADSDQVIKIHVKHLITNSTATTTRTINYVVDDSNYTGEVP